MLTPNRYIVKLLKQYDNKLYVKWNNQDTCFEVWRTMAWGNRLITPIVPNIYSPGAGARQFEPLDCRILSWLYSADSQRKGRRANWKWVKNSREKKLTLDKREKKRKEFELIAREKYNLINNELIGASTSFATRTWLEPDVRSNHRSRVYYRSADNIVALAPVAIILAAL